MTQTSESLAVMQALGTKACITASKTFKTGWRDKHYRQREKADERWLAALGVAASHKRKENRSAAGDFGIMPISW